MSYKAEPLPAPREAMNLRKVLLELAVLVISAVCVSVGLDYGVGVDFGWWGFLFWAGVGGLLGWVRSTS